MKREFLNQTKVAVVPFSIAIALSLAIGTATVSHADTKNLWNPKSWFNNESAAPATSTEASSAGDAVSDAKQKAEEAQQAAEQAMQAAKQAQERAEEAQRQAQALEKSSHAHKKHPVVTAPTEVKNEQANAPVETKSGSSTADLTPQPDRVYESSTQTETGSSTAASSVKPSTTQATAQNDKKEPWNPLNWFHKDEDKATGLDGSIPNEKAFQEAAKSTTASTEKANKSETQATETATTQKPEASTTETANSQAHGSWTLKNLFKKPTAPVEQQAETITKTETAEKPASQPETKTEESASEKTNQTPEQTSEAEPNKQAISSESGNTANAKSKSGGWNLLNLISKPSIPIKNQGIAPDTKEADKAPQQDSAETDQSVKTKAALIETERGNIAIELYPDQAPQTVANFVKLVNEGFYNRYNMKFHRVVPGFVVQTGDPTGTGAGGSKQRVPLEAKNKLSHNAKGVVAMARGADPDSATSQFYITLAPQTSLDGKYAIFGRVISGIDILSKIEKDDMLYGIRLVDLSSVVRDQQPEKKKFFSSLF